MKPKLFAAGLAGIVLAAGLARAETYFLTANTQIDGNDPVQISLTNAVGTAFTVTRTGDGSEGDPWTFDFSALDDPQATTIAFGTNRLAATRSASNTRYSFRFDFGGADVVGGSGSEIRTRRVELGSGACSADSVTVTNAGAMAIEIIDTRARQTNVNSDYFSGFIDIGTAGARVGPLTMKFLATDNMEGGGRIRSQRVRVFSAGDVVLSEDILAHTKGWNGPEITINHFGTLSVRDIENHTGGGNSASSRGGDITLNGNDGSGSATIRDILAWISGGNYSGGSQHTIRIQNYTDVTIRDIIAHGYSNTRNRWAAKVLIEDISGDVTVTGEIDLDADGNISRQGHVEISCGGTITLAGLDLDRMLYAALSSGGGKSTIEGELLNFDTTGSGSGSLNDPVETTQTALRVPNGQRLLYKVRDDANTELEGKVYRIANENGQAGTGGLLMPIPTRGTVLMFF